MRIHLTQGRCHSYLPAALAPTAPTTLWDQDGTGLGVKIKAESRKGTRRRSWVFGFTTTNARDTLNPKPPKYREMGLGSLAKRPSLDDVMTEVTILNGKVAQGIDPLDERQQLKKQAKDAKTMLDLAIHDLTVHFNTTWEKPESCKKAEKSSATRQRTVWVTHVLPYIGKMLVADVETNDVDAILKRVRTDYTDSVAASVRGVLNAVLNRAKKWNFIPKGMAWDNPVAGAIVIPVKKRRDVVMTREQLHAAVIAGDQLLTKISPESRYGLSHIRQILIFQVAADTGRRPGEIMGLEKRHVHAKSAFLPHTKASKHTDAQQEGQTFALSTRAVALLGQAMELAADSIYCFPADTESGHIEKVVWGWNAIRTKAGIPKEVVMYTARHCWASIIGQFSSDVKAASNQLGHSKLETTQIYMKPEFDDQARLAETVSAGMAQERASIEAAA